MRIGFFGAGNMANALTLSIKRKYPTFEFYVYSPSKITAQKLAKNLSGILIEELENMPADLDWYFLAFKPQNLADFNYKFRDKSKIVSILAGVSSIKLRLKLGDQKILRLMPNLPCAVSEGANLIYIPNYFNDSERSEIQEWSSSFGRTFYLENEDQIDSITPFSGSGPALILEFARIFQNELIMQTTSNIDSRELIIQTFLGTTLLMKNSSLSFSEMRDQVVSKKGVTFEALKVFDEEGLEKIFHNAFQSAYKRTIELSREG